MAGVGGESGIGVALFAFIGLGGLPEGGNVCELAAKVLPTVQLLGTFVCPQPKFREISPSEQKP